MNDRREARILLAVLRESWSEAERLCAGGGCDAGALLALARAADVIPWMHWRLEASGRLDLLGEAARSELERGRRRCRSENLLLLAHLEPVLDLLLRNGTRPIVLKGADFIHRFALPFDARTMDDADLLVRPSEALRAIGLLEAEGWAAPAEPARTHWLRSSYEMPLWSPGPVRTLLEVHWSLGQARRYAVPTEELFARAVPLRVAGREVLGLDLHDAAAHLLLHHLQHYFDRRLKWAIDLRRISAAAGFSWDQVRARLAAWNGRAAAAASLRHLSKLFPEWFSEELVRSFPCAAWRRALTWPLRSTHPLDYYRGTRWRPVQLWLAATFYEEPGMLLAYAGHRRVRDRLESAGPPGVDPQERR